MTYAHFLYACSSRIIVFQSRSADITFEPNNHKPFKFKQIILLYNLIHMMIHLCSLHDVTCGDDSACFTCSVMELVDAAVDPSLLEPIKETILRVHGVKVDFQ